MFYYFCLGFQVLIDWVNETTSDDVALNQRKRNSRNLSYQKLAFGNISKQTSRIDLNDSKLYYNEKENKNAKQKYNSCPDLNRAFSTLSLKASIDQIANDVDDEEQKSWSSHYQAHLNKQKSMANLSLLGTNKITQTNNIQVSPMRPAFYSFPPRKDWMSVEQLSMAESSLSIFSSMESLLISGRKSFHLKELRIKGNFIKQ